MNGCPPWPLTQPMLTIEPPTPSRRMTSAAAWIMNSGARTLTADHVLEVLRRAVHTSSRHVSAAATLTTQCTTPKCSSTASMTARGDVRIGQSTSTKSVGGAEVVQLGHRGLARSPARPTTRGRPRRRPSDLPGDGLTEALRASA